MLRQIKEVEENFKFLIIEVKKQAEDAINVLDKPYNKKLIDKMSVRDDYIDNLKTVIESKRVQYVLEKEIRKPHVYFIQSVVSIASNLEHIADHLLDMAMQTQYLKDFEILKRFNYRDALEKLLESLNLLSRALKKKDVTLAVKICKFEFYLDTVYKENFEIIINELHSGGNVHNLLTMLFIFQYIERIGDCALNIGEAIISMVAGKRLKIHQYEAMEKGLKNGSLSENFSKLSLESVGETRSGCSISKVKDVCQQQSAQWVIFKEGTHSKIVKEKENIEMWDKIEPGLTPKIFNFEKNSKSSSLVLEYLSGLTLKYIVINEDFSLIKQSVNALTNQLLTLWNNTRINEKVKTSYIDQIYARIRDVYTVHPEFKTQDTVIGDIKLPSFESMMKRISSIDKKFQAPFCVMTHGDFNIDNVIYNSQTKKIHFVDVYRSGYNDYVQDISVFLLSNIRLPILERGIRKKINEFIIHIYRFARDFAKDNNDDTFHIRLALGLIRSFTTSTRFELDAGFAKYMHLKAVYLLEKLISLEEKDLIDFELTEEFLVQ